MLRGKNVLVKQAIQENTTFPCETSSYRGWVKIKDK